MPPRDRRNDAVSLYVSGFKDNTRPSDLATLFEPHGRVADVYIPKDYYTGNPRGFAYIQYYDEEDARRVFESGEQFVLDGRKLGLQYAQGRRKTTEEVVAEEETVAAPDLPTVITDQVPVVIRAPDLLREIAAIAAVTAAAPGVVVRIADPAQDLPLLVRALALVRLAAVRLRPGVAPIVDPLRPDADPLPLVAARPHLDVVHPLLVSVLLQGSEALESAAHL
ncbi:Serine/arginine-rich splicing factor 10 [Linnemannia zychae]|nr:Serine/arginine-rich splicing factor 10 [Linnemannia zychae]